MPSNLAAQAGQGQLNYFEVYTNYDKIEFLDYSNGIIEIDYYESILDCTTRTIATFCDTGYRRDKKDGVSVFEKDDINMTSGEKVFFKMTDGYDYKLEFKNEKQFRINGDPQLNIERENRVIFSIDMYSQESMINDIADHYVYGRFDGEIPLNVETILKQTLKTEKEIFTDRGLNSYNFLGHAEKVFHLMPQLAKKCVPDLPDAFGNLAGYLFYETYDGYNFRSVDKLFMQKPKRKFIFNNLTDLPPGYDAKILDYSFVGSISLNNMIQTGAMTKSRKQEFNRMKNVYNENTKESPDQYKEFNNGGKERPKLADGPSQLEIGGEKKPLQDLVTRNFSDKMSDDGILPRGFSLAEQIPLSQKENLNLDQILRQSAMRYNQLFSHKLSITIPGDFELRAGDLVFVDFPEVSGKVNRVVSQKIGGIYMISDLCNRLTKNGCYTRLNLVRDSIYRKPF
jgi:hypothetical protein